MQTEISDLRARLIRVPVMQLKFQVPFSLTLSWCTYQAVRLPWMCFLKGRSLCASQNCSLDGGWWRLKLCPIHRRQHREVKHEFLSQTWESTATTMSWSPTLYKLRDSVGEIFRALCISADQAHFPCFVATLKYMISLWASGINKENFS